jgi:hypothetical protein
VVRCVVFFKFGVVERFGLEVGAESSGQDVRKFGVGGCVQTFATDRGGFVAPALTADCCTFEEVVVAPLRLVTCWVPMIVPCFVFMEIFPVGERREQNLKVNLHTLKQL